MVVVIKRGEKWDEISAKIAGQKKSFLTSAKNLVFLRESKISRVH